MPDREFINATPFAAQELYLADEEGRDLLVLVIRATYIIRPGEPLALADEQLPVNPAGVYNGKPGESSARYEPEISPPKVTTDVVLVGHAYGLGRGVRQLDVGLQVGPVTKVVRVFGDRVWYRKLGAPAISEPAPFEMMPLVYERAFGGWDRSPEDPKDHAVESRNPVGVGFHRASRGRFVEGTPLPNIEIPGQLITSYGDAPPPAGFGFVEPGWSPRARFAGTYDEAWMRERSPLLPKDFDRRFFNAAPTDQIASVPLRGDELVRVVNASPEGALAFHLPGEPPPSCAVRLRDGSSQETVAALDTVIVDTDAYRATLIWRAAFLLPRRLYDIRALAVRATAPGQAIARLIATPA